MRKNFLMKMYGTANHYSLESVLQIKNLYYLEILQKIIDCDVLVLSSPVYFYSVCAQLKAVIDRTVARWTEIANKDLYYIATAAEEDEDTLDITLACFHGFAMCIDGYEEKGTLYGKGVYEKGDVLNRPELVQIAYEMGLSVHD